MVTDLIYLKYKKYPTLCKAVYCNECKHLLNVGPNYKMKNCDQCGAKIEDDLDKIHWGDEDVTYYDYVQYMLNKDRSLEYNNKDYIIIKIKTDRTDYAKIGFDLEHIVPPVFIVEKIEDAFNLLIDDGVNYSEDDFEDATEKELIEYARLLLKEGNNYISTILKKD